MSQRYGATIFAVATLVVTGLAQTARATPEGRAAALFLLISPSVRVNGMGEGGVALVDEPGGYYNPGTVPLANPDHAFQSRAYLTGMDWLPSVFSGLTYSYASAQVASEMELSDSFLGDRLALRASVHGYRTKLDLGERTQTNERGEVIGTFTSEDYANHVGVGLGIISLVDMGVGVTAKRVSSDLGPPYGTASTNAYDYGFLLSVPAVHLLEKATGQSLSVNQYLRPVFDIRYGISWRNRGGEITYSDPEYTDPLPANRNQGWSASLGVDWDSQAVVLGLGRLTMTEETYTPQIDGASNIGRVDDDKSGVEIEILETVAFRAGEYSDYDGDVLLNTSGFTVQCDGVFKLASSYLKAGSDDNSQRATLAFLLDHLSISWSRFEYEDRGDNTAVDGISHAFIGLSF